MSSTAGLPPESHYELSGTYVIGPRRPRRRPKVAGAGILAFAVLLVAGGAATYFIARDRLHLPGGGQDPGVHACEAIVDAFQSGTTVDRDLIDSQLLASRNAHLRAAGEASQRMTANSNDFTELETIMNDSMLWAGSIGAGCTEVGVSLPAGMFATQ
jgi:hypothetical protein